LQAKILLKKMMKKLLLLILFLIFAINLTGCATSSKEQPRVNAEEDSQSTLYKWGVEVLDIKLTAADNLLHFRYKIIDPDKASPLTSLHVKPYVIDQKTGYKIMVPNLPKVGSLRQRSREARPDLIYFILFANPGMVIKSGDKVTVVIGDLRVADLTVK